MISNSCDPVGLAPELLKLITAHQRRCASQAAPFQICCIRILVAEQRNMEGRSLPEISIEMTWDRIYVRTAIEEGNNTDWATIRAFLSYLGFDVRFVQVVFSPAMSIQAKANVICFPVRGKQGLNSTLT